MVLHIRQAVSLAGVFSTLIHGVVCDQVLGQRDHVVTNIGDGQVSSVEIGQKLNHDVFTPANLGKLAPQLDQPNKFVKAPSALYDDCKGKGDGLVCDFGSADDLPQRTWTYGDLQRWGWRLDEAETIRGTFSENYAECAVALEALGVQGAGGQEVVDETWNHNQAFRDATGEHKGSEAQFHNGYSPRAGVIVANNNESPQFKKRDDPSIVLPELQAWSDVTWLEWAHQCEQAGVDPGSLKYIIREFIKNPDTTNVIEGILRARGPDVQPDCPGLRLDINTDDGKALLGTPNGKGPGWMLLQHRAGIKKRFKDVTVWMPKKTFLPDMAQYFMLFQLEDA